MAESITADDINNALEEVYLHKHIVDKTPNCSIEEAVKRRDNLKEIWAIENPHGNMLELNQLALSYIIIYYSLSLQKAIEEFRKCTTGIILLPHSKEVNDAIDSIINSVQSTGTQWYKDRLAYGNIIKKRANMLLQNDLFYPSELVYILYNIRHNIQKTKIEF